MDSDTDVKDLKRHLKDLDIAIVERECVFHPEAHFKSFKLTVPISQMDDLLTDDIWPNRCTCTKVFRPAQR